MKLEQFLAQLEAEGADDDLEECLEDRAMKMAQEEMFQETGGRFKPWCANGKSIRVGEIILIIDSDTIVPEVCEVFSYNEYDIDLQSFTRIVSGMLRARWVNPQMSLLSSMSQVRCPSPMLTGIS